MNVPYTYLIGWSNLNKWYYGVRYSGICNPKDLWVFYFTSSKYVAMMREEFGEPDVIQIRKTFDSGFKARLWEEKVLNRIGVKHNKKWLNVRDGSFHGIIAENSGCPLGTKRTDEFKRRRSEYMKEHFHNPENVEKVRQYHLGKKRPLETGQKISKALKNKPKSEKHKKNLSESRTGFKVSEEQKIKMKEISANKRWFTDGINEKFLDIGSDIPEGWVKGRVYRQRKRRG